MNNTPLHWSLLHRVGFRFAACYLVLYSIFNVATISLQFLPIGTWEDPIIRWVARWCFGMELSTQGSGSGDRPYHYISLLLWLAVAALLTALWSAAAFRQRHHHTLHGWVHALVRYALGSALIIYGMAKVLAPRQFPEPGPYAWMSTYAEASPMALAWNFMGASQGYTIFGGLAELIPGLLLFFRPFAMPAAFAAAAVMANVMALNYFYDVPVKLFSTHLFLMAVFVSLPALGRLYQVLLRRQPAEPLTFARLPYKPLRIAWQIAKCIAVALLLSRMVDQSRQMEKYMAGRRPELYGVYRVTAISTKGEPQETRAWHWSEVAFDSGYGQSKMDGTIFIRTRDGTRLRESYKNQVGQHLEGRFGRIQLSRPAPGRLSLTINSLEMELEKAPEPQLLNRGFHWIRGVPAADR